MIQFSRSIVEGAASRVRRTRIEFQRASKVFNQALKETKKSLDDPETMNADIKQLRARKLDALKEYEGAQISLAAVSAVPPL